jgi:hypothetical protein
MTPKQEAETLMNEILPVAERMLKKYGEFYPYGGCMRPDGTITHVGATDEDTPRPKSKDLLFILRNAFREMAGRGDCKAVAVAFDMSITLPNSDERSDAIQMSIEHADGYSVDIFFPYRLSAGEISYGETLVQQGKHEIFGVS